MSQSNNNSLSNLRNRINRALHLISSIAASLERGAAAAPIATYMNSLSREFLSDRLSVAVVLPEDSFPELAKTIRSACQPVLFADAQRESPLVWLTTAGETDGYICLSPPSDNKFNGAMQWLSTQCACVWLTEHSRDAVTSMYRGHDKRFSYGFCEPLNLADKTQMQLPIQPVDSIEDPAEPCAQSLLEFPSEIIRLTPNLICRFRLRRLATAIQVLNSSLVASARYCDTKRLVLAEQIALTNSRKNEQAIKQAIENDLRLVADGLEEIERTLLDRCQQRLTAKADFLVELGRFADSLDEPQITEQPGLKTSTIKIQDSFLASAQQKIQEALQRHIRDDSLLLSNATNQVQTQLKARLNSLNSAPTDLQASESVVLDRIHLAKDYTGEVPLHRWSDRLMYGRRPVFALMMVVSLIGGALGVRSAFATTLAPVMFGLFLVGVAWTFRSFRAERNERMQRELVRMRQAFTNDLKRNYELAIREWQSRASQWLRDRKRDISREVDQLGRVDVERCRQSDEEARKELQERMRVYDRRARELQEWSNQLNREQASVSQMVLDCDKQLASLLESAQRQLN